MERGIEKIPARLNTFEAAPHTEMSLEERADTPELKALLEKLHTDARRLEDMLYASYGANPSRQEIAGVLDYVRNDRMHQMRRLWMKEHAVEAADHPPPDLLSIATSARAFGKHHKNYHVGAAFLGLRTDAPLNENPWVVFFNANTKVDPAHKPGAEAHKWCAERYGLADARKRGIKILCIAVAAEPRELEGVQRSFKDDESGKKQITLTPCGPCRDAIEECMISSKIYPAVADADTEIYTVNVSNPDHLIEKVQKAGDLKRFHGHPPPQEVII